MKKAYSFVTVNFMNFIS